MVQSLPQISKSIPRARSWCSRLLDTLICLCGILFVLYVHMYHRPPEPLDPPPCLPLDLLPTYSGISRYTSTDLQPATWISFISCKNICFASSWFDKRTGDSLTLAVSKFSCKLLWTKCSLSRELTSRSNSSSLQQPLQSESWLKCCNMLHLFLEQSLDKGKRGSGIHSDRMFPWYRGPLARHLVWHALLHL